MAEGAVAKQGGPVPKVSTAIRNSPGGSSAFGAGSFRFFSEDYAGTFLKTIGQLRHNETFCDVQFCVQNEVFPAHRVVLMAGSPFFYAMFFHEMTEHTKDTVPIGGVEPQIFSALLDFIYSGEIEITEESCQDLLTAADMYSIPGVITACSKFLKERLETDNCIGVFLFAEVHSCIDLRKNALTFIHKHFVQVCREEEYFELSKDDLLKFLYSEDLSVENEFQVFQAALSWIMHDVGARRKHVFDIMSAIRFPIIPDKQIDKFVEGMQDLSLQIAIQKILKDFRSDKRSGLDKMVKFKPFHSVPRKCARKNIYVVGGFNRPSGGRWSDAKTLSIVERFDTFHQQWHSMPSMKFPRSSHGVGVVNGQICVIGGENDSLIFDTVETYDPVTHEWTCLPGMTTPRCGLGVCTIDNCLFALGGWVGSEIGSTVEKYDPGINKWAVVGTTITRRFGMGVVGDGGLIYIVGGSNDLGEELSSVERFNPVTKEWITLPDLVTKRSYVGVAVLSDCLYAIGGWNDLDGALNTVEKYSFGTGYWTEVPKMLSARAAPSVAVINDILYVIGGRSYKDEYTAPSTLDTMECYDPETNSWLDMGFMPTSRCEAGAVVL